MEKRDYKKEFCRLMEKFAFRYSKWQVWTDFLSLSAISMANIVPAPEREEREERYLAIMDGYQKEEQEIFPEMLGLVTLALEENPEQDFLGSLYHYLNLQQEQKGQFFTPYHICEFMSEVQFSEPDASEEVGQKGYISVSDPACGAGAMLIAFANVAKKHGLNYQQQVLFVAQDIDRTAAMMCYIQMSLLGCPAIVVIGDSLAEPFPHPNNEVWCTLFYYLNHWRFASGEDGEKQESIRLTEGADGQLMLCMEQAS